MRRGAIVAPQVRRGRSGMARAHKRTQGAFSERGTTVTMREPGRTYVGLEYVNRRIRQSLYANPSLLLSLEVGETCKGAWGLNVMTPKRRLRRFLRDYFAHVHRNLMDESLT